jgi:flagellar biosynthesis protein FlhB
MVSRKKRGSHRTCGRRILTVIFPIMLIHLIPEVGFAWAMRTCSFLILTLLVFANLAVRSRTPPTKRLFQVMALIRPFKELTFVLLTSSIFFFFCKSHTRMETLITDLT